jgi:hypothetical protein
MVTKNTSFLLYRAVVVAFVSIVAFVVSSVVPAQAQSDLDDLMRRVLAGRDRNWAELAQYVLEERETLRATGPVGAGLYGFDREYSWFPRDGIFVRSPRVVDGVTVDEDERLEAERDWIRGERRRGRTEPRFVAYAYFLRFQFEAGRYALVGREELLGRPVLKIEYYPTRLFAEGRARPSRDLRERDPDVEAKMNKAATVTFWIDPADNQILQYHAVNTEMEFLPGRALMRLEGVEATMKMVQPFPEVWLPGTIEVKFNGTTALGDFNAQYDIRYYDYRLAEVTTRVR